MIAVFINSAGARLGWTRVGFDCRLIQFGGLYFVKTDQEAVIEDAEGLGTVFESAEIHVFGKLDYYNPTKNFSKKQGKE